MPEPVIKVTDISKRYRIGAREEQAKTFAEQLKRTATYPIRNFQRIARMKNFQESNDPTEFWALRDINFEVQQGEVLGIIGHNGAGKSTLLKILSRITEPTTGRIEIKGRVSSLLEVGTGFHPELTGRDNVYMNGTILGMRKREIDAKFEEIVEFAGIAQHIDTPVKFYSSGMTVRLAFSVAAHLDPEILIVDEVLAVGDADFQRKCLGKMEEVSSGQGRTVLFVSHNMNAVKSLCNETILLKKGRIIYRGPSDQTVLNYIHQNEKKDSGKIDFLNTGSHNSKTSNSFLREFYITNSKEKITNQLLIGEPFALNLSICSPVGVKGLFPVVRIEGKDGTRLVITKGTDENFTLDLKEGERKTIKILFTLPKFLNGSYSVSIHFRNSLKIDLQRIDHLTTLEIMNIVYDEKEISGRVTDGRWGFITTPVNYFITS